jgi:glyoxylate utilization-related uncharacterized protein
MYVIDGELLYYVEGNEHRLGSGSFVTALRGTPHAFMVTSETATVFAFHTPGWGQSFYLDASDPAGDPELREDADIPRLQRSAADHEEAELLGPPPFSR